jgi:hypothetical protein
MKPMLPATEILIIVIQKIARYAENKRIKKRG